MMMMTGETVKAQSAGIYACTACGTEHKLKEGYIVPTCANKQCDGLKFKPKGHGYK